MQHHSRRKSVLALSLMTILGGCANDKLLKEAGTTIGTANARVTLPELPGSCTKEYNPVIPRAGQEPLVGLKKANGVIKAGNRDNVNCAAWYGDLSKNLAGGEVPVVIVPPR